ncbi:hypothetical protein AYX14_06599 [Cryptococcus neoformans]|nr:hypothetical protein AYX14_06599 [Cryptococcus neoformans var. grubii]
MKGRVAITGTRAPGIVEETEEQDELRGLRSESKLGRGGLGFNLSSASVGSRNKTDEMLGLDANAKLASLYLVSGLGKNTAEWSLADTTRGVQPLEDSLGLFWRPDMLGSCFSGDEQHNRSATQGEEDHRYRKNSKSSTFSNGGLSKDLRGKHVADAGTRRCPETGSENAQVCTPSRRRDRQFCPCTSNQLPRVYIYNSSPRHSCCCRSRMA